LTERDHFEDPGVGGKVISKYVFKIWVKYMNWIAVAQGRGRWPALVNTVINSQFPCSLTS